MSAIPGNLLTEVNSDVETGTPDWLRFSGGSEIPATIVSDNGFSGAHSVQGDTGGGAVYLVFDQSGTTTPTADTDYTLSFRWKMLDGGGAAPTKGGGGSIGYYEGGAPDGAATADTLPGGFEFDTWYSRSVRFTWPSSVPSEPVVFLSAGLGLQHVTLYDFVCLRESADIPEVPIVGESVTTGVAVASVPGATATGQSATTGVVNRARVPWSPPATARTMPITVVEAAVGQPFDTAPDERVWTRLDEECCVRSIETEEGRNARLDAVEVGKYGLVLDNRTAALDPTNSASPWWSDGRPGVDYGTWIRVTVYEDPDDETGLVLFEAMVRRIYPEWNLGDAIVRYELVDSLQRLADVKANRGIIRHDLVATDTVINVWPLDVPGDTILDAKGTADGTWSSSVAVGAPILPLDSSPATLLGPSNVAGEIPVTLANGAGDFWCFAVWVQLDPDLTADDDVVLQLTGTSHSISLTANMPAGTLTLTGTGATPGDSGVVIDGELHLLIIERRGNLGIYSLRVDDTFSATVIITTSPTGLTLDTAILGSSTAAAVGSYSYATLTAGDGASPGSEFLPHLWDWAHEPWAGDDTSERFQRLCTIAGIESTVEGTGFPACATADDNALSDKAIDHAIKCANGDGAHITVDHDAGGVALYRLVDPDDPVAWLDTSAVQGAPIAGLTYVYGVDRLVGAVKVVTGSGLEALSTSTQPYPSAPTLELATNLATVTDAQSRADEVRMEREIPRELVPEMVLIGRDLRVPWNVLFLRPGDLIGILAHPPGRAPVVQVATVESRDVELDWKSLEWTVTYGLDRVAQWLTWQDVIDNYETWADVIAAFDTWADLLASGAPNPPIPEES